MKGRTKLERKGRGFRDRLLSLGIMAAVLVIAALVLIFKRDMDSVVLKDGAYNYFGDVKSNIQENAESSTRIKR